MPLVIQKDHPKERLSIKTKIRSNMGAEIKINWDKIAIPKSKENKVQ